MVTILSKKTTTLMEGVNVVVPNKNMPLNIMTKYGKKFPIVEGKQEVPEEVTTWKSFLNLKDDGIIEVIKVVKEENTGALPEVEEEPKATKKVTK